jgi:hypothetical protein
MNEKAVRGYFISQSTELTFCADLESEEAVNAHRKSGVVELNIGNLSLTIPPDVVPLLIAELGRA